MEYDPLYTSVCNAITLQSQRQGFFQDYANTVTSEAGPVWIEEFGNLQTDKDRFLKCFNDEKLCDVIHGPLQNIQPLFRKKSAKIAQIRRLEGESAILSNNNSRALLLLTQSVIQAPYTDCDKSIDNGLTLTLALWHRSTALLNLKEYKLCLTDVQQSLKEKLPEDFKIDAYYRMSECYIEMKMFPKARITLKLGINFLDSNTSDWKKKLDDKINFLDKLANPDISLTDSEEKHPIITDGLNLVLPNASSLIQAKSSATTGRYAVATNFIKTGDTLVVEPPFSACLLPDKFGSHCHHCFKRLRSAYACKDCGGIAFCSIECQDIACKTYHAFECKFMDILIGSGMSILCHIALRTVTQQKLNYWLQHFTNKIDASDFNRVLNLVAHEEKRSAIDFVNRTLMAMFLLRVLKCSGYFPGSDEDKLSDIELYIGSVMLRLLQTLQFNAHEIYETLLKTENDFRSSKVVYKAVGIYPTVAAYFNHDCYPAVARYFSGKNIVLRALRPLAPGEVVPENYGPVFCKKKLIERKRHLASRYWFQCICESCKEDWPSFSEMDRSIRFRCKVKNCQGLIKTSLENNVEKIKCSECKQYFNVTDNVCLVKSYLDSFLHATEFMDKGELDKATAILSEFSDQMHLICKPPFKEMSLSHIALTTCWANNSNTYII
uniref:Uncharacterized protein n=1 Tax=Clastoptera arizonana TaxID=38151 RepID=A0A1B6DV01_9HEMI